MGDVTKMSEYQTVYDDIKAHKKNYDVVLPTRYDLDKAALLRLQHECEMVLVREFDDWYVGSPAPNISQAIHKFCKKLARRNIKHVPRVVRSVGAVLAWVYATLDHDVDDAYLLLTHSLNSLHNHDLDRIIPGHLVPFMHSMLAKWREDRGMPGDLSPLDQSERAIWDEITRWEVDPLTSAAAMEEHVSAAKEKVAAAIPDSILKPITDALEGALLAAQDVANGLVRSGALLEEVREHKLVKQQGLHIEELEDLRQVPLAVLDGISKTTMQGGKVLAGGKGILIGLTGIIGMVVDLPALVTLNLRFISQIAATYGFDVTDSEEERMFALNVLGASTSSQAAKTAFLKNLNEIAVAVGKRKAWKHLNSKFVVQLIQKLAKSLGVRLTKKKLGQLIPIVGSVVAGGSNYKFTHDNLVAARMLYRKRWLIERCLRSSSLSK